MHEQQLVDFCLSKGVVLSSVQLAAFNHFEEALYQTNEHTNLTRVPRSECMIRHFIDSLLVMEFIPESAGVLDIGSGPGFPSWPLACARPDLWVTALDSAGKATGFLLSQPLANLKVFQGRAEEFHQREKFDVVTGRAVAPFSVQMELSAPFCKKGGKVILFRTPNEEEEIKNFPAKILGLMLKEVQTRVLPGTDIIRLFPVYEKVHPTPKTYPRMWAKIKQAPL